MSSAHFYIILPVAEAIKSLPYASSGTEISVKETSIFCDSITVGVGNQTFTLLISAAYANIQMGAFLYHLGVNGTNISLSNYSSNSIWPIEIAYIISVGRFNNGYTPTDGICVQGDWSSNSTSALIPSYGSYTASLSSLECALPADKFIFLHLIFSRGNQFQFNISHITLTITAYYLP